MKTFNQFYFNIKEDNIGRNVALVPGSFKPPHKGHFEMFKHYAKHADEVIVAEY